MEERDWVTKYYRELEREKRQEILEQAIAQEGMRRTNGINCRWTVLSEAG